MPGNVFIDFVLGDIETKLLRREGPLAILFWRTGCPTSRLTLSFWQRLACANPLASVVGICQDEPDVMLSYCKENAITFPQESDHGLAVSRQFSISEVPTYLLTDSSGIGLIQGEGWDLEKFEEINRELAVWSGSTVQDLVGESGAPAFKPG